MGKRAIKDSIGKADIRGGHKTFVATVVAVYLATLAFPQHPFGPQQKAALIAAGGLYLLWGMGGIEWYLRSRSPLVLTLFYTLETLLASLIVYWTAGFFLAGLILLPLAGLSVQILSRRWMAVACGWIVVVLALAYGLRGGWEAVLLAGIGYSAAVVFVVVITQATVRERAARAEVEHLAAELSAANRQLRAYVVQAEELAVARERARLAGELHDSVGHILTALDVQLELLVRLPTGQTEQRRKVAEQARALVKAGLADLRRAVQALRPIALETFSLPEAIADLVTDFEQATHLPMAWQAVGETRPLPPRLALPLYRAAQEALSNVQHHAPEAQRVTVRLDYEPEAVVLTVENDGVALLPSPRGRGAGGEGEGGYGLRGLRERAEALGGSFQAGPDGEGGFRLEMGLPEGI